MFEDGFIIDYVETRLTMDQIEDGNGEENHHSSIHDATTKEWWYCNLFYLD